MDITATLDSGILSVDGVPDCFMTPLHAQAHLDSWAKVPIEVNLEGDAFAGTAYEEEEWDESERRTIGYACLAWQSDGWAGF